MDSLIISVSVVALITALMAWRGYNNGFIRTMQRVVSLLLAYASCYLFVGSVAKYLQQQMNWSFMPAFVLGSTIVFLVVLVLSNGLMGLVASRLEKRGVETAQISGATAGALLGCFLGLVMVWLGGIMYDAAQIKQGSGNKAKLADDPVRAMMGKAVGNVVGYAVKQQYAGDSLAPAVVSNLVANPVALTQQVAQVSQSEAMRGLLSDRYAQKLMLENRTNELRKNKHFRRLMSAPQTAELLALLGNNKKNTRGKSDSEAAAILLSDLYRRVARVQQDERFIELQKKQEYKALAQNANPVTMLSSPIFSDLTEIILDQESENKKTSGLDKASVQKQEDFFVKQVEDNPESEVDEADNEQRYIYRWVDEYGNKHYSENKPEGDYDVRAMPISQ